jgi:5-methylthioadenosine/S-adenosylhomocysteine deaminase
MKTPIDLLIEARWIIPVEPDNVVLENHSIAVDKGTIVAILQHTEAQLRFSPRQYKQLPQHIVIPGLINLHSHAATALLRALRTGLPPMEWRPNPIWPADAKQLSAQFVHDGTRLACAEMLRGGITCFNDQYFFPKASARAALSAGMRAAIGLLAVDFPTSYASDADDYLDKGLAARDELRDETLLSFCLAPHSPATADDRSLARVLTLAEQCELPIHMHLHESKSEIEQSLKRYGRRPIERLRRLGLLSPNLIAAHATHLSDEEIALLAEHGCSIAHCPSASLQQASGGAALAALTQKGVNGGLGTDGEDSNNRLDMFQEMRLAALLTKGGGDHGQTTGAARALRMATLGGAQALGLDAKIGSIGVGKAADLCAINANDIALAPCYNALSLVVYSAGREHVSDVWIAGQIRFADGRLLEASEIELIKLAALWQNQICPRNV